MAQGTVKCFDGPEQLGYIAPDEGGAEVFVHASAIVSGQTTLEKNQRVEYQSISCERGPQAGQVQVL